MSDSPRTCRERAAVDARRHLDRRPRGRRGPPVVLLHGPMPMRPIGGVAGPGTRPSRCCARPARPRASEPADGGPGSAALIAWLGQLIERTCESPPSSSVTRSAAPSRLASPPATAIASTRWCWSIRWPRPFDPAPDFGAALQEYVAEPSERTHDLLWRHCALDLERLREEMGNLWAPFAAYDIDRPHAGAAGRRSAGMGELGYRRFRGGARRDPRPDHPGLGPPRARDAHRDRRAGARPLRLGAGDDRGLRRRPAHERPRNSSPCCARRARRRRPSTSCGHG